MPARSETTTYRSVSFSRIGAMVLRYWYLLRSSWTRLAELMYWPAVQLFVWGFLQLYITRRQSEL